MEAEFPIYTLEEMWDELHDLNSRPARTYSHDDWVRWYELTCYLESDGVGTTEAATIH